MGYTQWGAFAELVAARSALLWPVPDGMERGRRCSVPSKLLHRILRLLEGGIHWRAKSGCWRRTKRI